MATDRVVDLWRDESSTILVRSGNGGSTHVFVYDEVRQVWSPTWISIQLCSKVCWLLCY